MKLKLYLTSVLAVLCSGCANLMTIERRTELPNSGKAIHLDAPQRLVFANKDGHVCAEPSPDALQAYASSFGMSVSKPDVGAATLANAFSGSSAGIGLRTQAITLMRDSLYRNCEAELNGALNNPAAVQLLQRSQDLSLGVLAIEQLTGAVVASQPVLNMGATAEASANINNMQKTLDQAKQDQTAKEDTLTKANDSQTKAQSAIDDAKRVELSAKANAAMEIAIIGQLEPILADNETKLETTLTALIEATTTQTLEEEKLTTLTNKLEQAKKDKKPQSDINAIQSEIDKQVTVVGTAKTASDEADKTNQDQKEKVHEYQSAINSKKETDNYKVYDVAVKDREVKQQALDKAKSNVAKAQSSVDQAKKVVESIQSNLNAATTTAKASTTGDGSSTQAHDRNIINRDTVAQISAATKDIVELFINKGRVTDTCSSILTAAVSNSTLTLTQGTLYSQLLQPCLKVFDANVQHFLNSKPGDIGTRPFTLSPTKQSIKESK